MLELLFLSQCYKLPLTIYVYQFSVTVRTYP